MNKNDYKKLLIDLRNTYITYKRNLQEQLVTISNNTIYMQKDYLDKITFNMISSDNSVSNAIGSFIAYRLFDKATNKRLLDITTTNYEKYDKVKKEIKRADIEYTKINNMIDFINSIDDNQFTKYLNYKKN